METFSHSRCQAEATLFKCEFLHMLDYPCHFRLLPQFTECWNLRWFMPSGVWHRAFWDGYSPLEQRFSTCGSQPHRGHISHTPHSRWYQIFTLPFVTAAKLQLWCSNKAVLQLGVSTTGGTLLQGRRTGKAENCCSRVIVKNIPFFHLSFSIFSFSYLVRKKRVEGDRR